MVVYSWTLPVTQWEAYWQQRPTREGMLVLAERTDQVVLTASGEEAAQGPWRRGHLFDASTYVRWRLLGDRVRVVATGTVDAVPDHLPEDWPAPEDTLQLSDAEAVEVPVVLWGRQEPGEAHWLELQLPKIMTAPVHHPPPLNGSGEGLRRRMLRVVHYREAATGRVLFQRYTGLVTAHNDADDTRLDPLAA